MKKFSELNELAAAPDCDVIFTGRKLYSDDFNSEKELSNFIELNIVEFTKDILCDDLIDYTVQLPINKRIKKAPRGRTLDLFVRGLNSIYIIELKNPKSPAENRTAIGQVLDYGREFPDPKKEMLIITTKFDINTAKTIEHYNLPIRYIFMSKAQSFEYKGVGDND